MIKKNFNIQELLFNFAVADIFAFFVYQNFKYYLNTGSISTLLFLMFEALVVILVLIRPAPFSYSKSPKEWTVAFIGTYFPALLISGLQSFEGRELFLIPQIIGIMISFAGILSLNRSFGIVPANRGIKTTGIYRYIRHPLYAGYILSNTSFLIQNFSIWNLLVILAVFSAFIFRIFYEENFLSQDAEYLAYMSQTKARLLPYVW